MTNKPTHYGWECSPFSAKTRAYLDFKRIPYADVSPNAIDMAWLMQRCAGSTAT